MNYIFDIIDKGGRKIHLAKERWKYIQKHPFMHERLEDIKLTLTNPLAMRYFEDARRVERFIFTVDSIRGMTGNRLFGKSIDLRFDATDQNNCKLVVQDDDNNWVDAVFCRLNERIMRYKNINGIVRNRWVPFSIQIIGVIVGFLLSLWIAIQIAPKVAIDNALAFCFIIAFLLFSNTWTVIFEMALRFINYFWPNIAFKPNGALHWLIQALISTALVGILLVKRRCG